MAVVKESAFFYSRLHFLTFDFFLFFFIHQTVFYFTILNCKSGAKAFYEIVDKRV